MERLLHATHPEPKFWAISVSGSTITLRTGPLHTPGTSRTIECKSPQAALTTAEALVAQRLKDGFRVAEAAQSPAADRATEAALLRDDVDAWAVFADSLLESAESVRGEFIALQIRAARRERGAIGKAKAYLKEHFDALVGAPLAACHNQTFLDWRFGYARTVRVWSGPHAAPISEVLEAVLQSPACRFLQKLEFGSPGNEGRYDLSLRTLAKLPWPTHLDSLFLGNFDVVAARITGSAWPRLESLLALAPVADRLRSLEVRAAFNTFGKGLALPKLERLVLMPTALDARLAADLLTLEAPLLQEAGFGCDAPPRAGWEGYARVVRQWLALTKLKKLVLREQRDAVQLLEYLGDDLKRLDAVDLSGAVRVEEIDALRSLAPVLKHATLMVGDAVTVAKRLGSEFPRLDTSEPEVKSPKAMKRPVRRARDLPEDRYDEIVE